jgi:hypothetical protein
VVICRSSRLIEIADRLTLYKVESQLCRAGVRLVSVPSELSKGIKWERLKGGTYSRFTLKGP